MPRPNSRDVYHKGFNFQAGLIFKRLGADHGVDAHMAESDVTLATSTRVNCTASCPGSSLMLRARVESAETVRIVRKKGRSSYYSGVLSNLEGFIQ